MLPLKLITHFTASEETNFIHRFLYSFLLICRGESSLAAVTSVSIFYLLALSSLNRFFRTTANVLDLLFHMIEDYIRGGSVALPATTDDRKM